MLSDINFFLEVQEVSQNCWKQEGKFPDFSDAYEYAMEKFPQNYWRICDNNSVLLHQHNALDAFINNAISESARFSRAEAWNRHYRRINRPVIDDFEVDLEAERASRNFVANLRVIIRDSDFEFKEKVNWLKEGF